MGAISLTSLREASLVKINCDKRILVHLCVDQICINRSVMSSLCTGLNSGVLPLSRPTKGVGRPMAGPNFPPHFLVMFNGYHMVQQCMSECRGRPVQA